MTSPYRELGDGEISERDGSAQAVEERIGSQVAPSAPEVRKLTIAEVSEHFDQLARAVRALKILNDRRDLIYSMNRHSGAAVSANPNPNPGDPTSALATGIADLRPQWEAEEEALLAVIADGRELCHGVGKALGIQYGLALEYHYIWDLQWKQVARMLGIGTTATYKLRSSAFDYVRIVGYKGAMSGRDPYVNGTGGD